jgi:hypothetical protein
MVSRDARFLLAVKYKTIASYIATAIRWCIKAHREIHIIITSKTISGETIIFKEKRKKSTTQYVDSPPASLMPKNQSS